MPAGRKRIISRSPDAFIAVTGCYAQLRPEELASIPGVDLVLGTNERFNIAGFLEDTSKDTGPRFIPVSFLTVTVSCIPIPPATAQDPF